MARRADPVARITPELIAAASPDERFVLEQLLERKAFLTGTPLPVKPWPTDNPEQLLREIAPHIAYAPLGAHHREFWEHVWRIVPGVRPPPLVALWNRGAAKSASAELAAVVLGGERRRRYCVYVSGTQDLADDHVGSLANVLESSALAAKYPALADRQLGKFGHKSWRRQRLQTRAGYTVDAVGLDAATRGRRIEEQRPDLIVVDDFDALGESVLVTLKKLRTITGTIIPMGSPDLALIVAQNLIHENSIARRIAEPDLFPERERLLGSAHVIGPIPAVDNLQTTKNPDPETGRDRVRILAGTATWEGLPLEACESIINDVGLPEFKREYQHDMTAPAGGIFSHIEWKHCPWDDVPWGRALATEVWVDPAVTSNDGSDSQGIQADMVTAEGIIYRLFSFEQITTPTEAIKQALLAAHVLKATAVGVETDQGGDTWLPVFREAVAQLTAEGLLPQGFRVKFRERKAGGIGSKVERAQEMVQDYDFGFIRHVTGGPFSGSYLLLEKALHRFPLTKPLDLVDAAVWSWRAMRRLVKAPLSLDKSVGAESNGSKWKPPGPGAGANAEKEVVAQPGPRLPAPEPVGVGPRWSPENGQTTRSGWSI